MAVIVLTARIAAMTIMIVMARYPLIMIIVNLMALTSISIVILSKPQPNLNTMVGFDMKMILQTPPPHHRNSSGTSRRARELKFGTDTH